MTTGLKPSPEACGAPRHLLTMFHRHFPQGGWVADVVETKWSTCLKKAESIQQEKRRHRQLEKIWMVPVPRPNVQSDLLCNQTYCAFRPTVWSDLLYGQTYCAVRTTVHSDLLCIQTYCTVRPTVRSDLLCGQTYCAVKSEGKKRPEGKQGKERGTMGRC